MGVDLSMRIYYFGELIEDTLAKKTDKTKNAEKNKSQIVQTSLDLNNIEQSQKKTGMESIGELLRELDLNIDAYNPLNSMRFGSGNNA